MLRTITCALACATTIFAPLAASADDSRRLLSEVRFTTIKSFKLDMIYHTPQGEFDKVVTYVAPDRLRIDIPTRKMAAVTIGRLVWIRDADNKWHKQELPAGVDPMGAVHNLTQLSQSVKSKIVTYVGDETLDGVKTHVYNLAAPPKHGFSAITEKLWLGADGYPRKLEQKNGPFTMRATYTDLNAALSVSGP